MWAQNGPQYTMMLVIEGLDLLSRVRDLLRRALEGLFGISVPFSLQGTLCEGAHKTAPNSLECCQSRLDNGLASGMPGLTFKGKLSSWHPDSCITNILGEPKTSERLWVPK